MMYSPALLLLAPLALAANCPPSPNTSPAAQRASFLAFVDLFYRQRNVSAAFTGHVDESYIQHNPYFLSGRTAAVAGLEKAVPGMLNRVARVSISDGTGVVFYKSVAAGGAAAGKPAAAAGREAYRAVVDVFRLEGACVMEHWDVIQTRPADARNPLALFDGQDI
jgi:predicted SnoaL-like aldol condensation-catalyzing enzyme